MRKVERACAFTGHRPRKFPWGYDELDARCVSLKSALTEQIEQLARNLLEMPEFNHQVLVERGVLGEECSQMLTEFFKELRSRKSESR